MTLLHVFWAAGTVIQELLSKHQSQFNSLSVHEEQSVKAAHPNFEQNEGFVMKLEQDVSDRGTHESVSRHHLHEVPLVKQLPQSG